MPEQGGNERPTLIRPPPTDPDKSPIENALDVLELNVFGPVCVIISSILLIVVVVVIINVLMLKFPFPSLRIYSPIRDPYGILQGHVVFTGVR